MAENQGVSALPLPPMQYVNHYTDENIKKGRAPLPPPTIQDNYMMFGAPFSAEDVIIRPLESQGIRRLYPQNYDHKRELKKLNHSLLINFLDLIDVLVTSPESQKRQEKMEDLNLIFIHMHHLINEFRPHQARETLRVMLDVQNKQCLEITDRFQKHLDKVQEIVQTAVASLPDDNTLQSVKSLIEAELASSGTSGITSCGVEVNIKKEPHDSAMEMGESAAGEPCDRLDRMMCDIIDTMNT